MQQTPLGLDWRCKIMDSWWWMSWTFVVGPNPFGFVWKWCSPTPNGFADDYPYEKWLFHWGYTPFSDILIYWLVFHLCPTFPGKFVASGSKLQNSCELVIVTGHWRACQHQRCLVYLVSDLTDEPKKWFRKGTPCMFWPRPSWLRKKWIGRSKKERQRQGPFLVAKGYWRERNKNGCGY